jgi:hypothetical protein
VIDVPRIEPYKFGFDDARNISMRGIVTEDNFEWFLWIDTDEYLAGDFRRYLRDSALDAYLIAQHHFTVRAARQGTRDRPPCPPLPHRPQATRHTATFTSTSR